MSRRFLIAGALGVIAVLLWGASGGFDRLALWAAQSQREVQNAMAGLLRALRAGEPGALAGLMGLCFAYGFFHAVGPGHGKLVLGGYGAARRVTAVRLSALAVASSLAQAGTAVVVVYAGVLVFDWSREQMQAVGDAWMAPLSYAAIALVGLWLFWRGLRGWRQAVREHLAHAHAPAPVPAHAHGHIHTHTHSHSHDHAHDHGAHHTCAHHDHDHGHGHVHGPGCGHKHAPTMDEAAHITSLREAAAVVGAIAIRPCTGALFLLILTWRMGIEAAGIAGAFVMGLGTATVTVLVALAAVTLREGALIEFGRVTRVVPVLEVVAGAVVLLVSGQLLLRSL